MQAPNASPSLPLVLVPSCQRLLGEHPFHVAGAKYVQAVRLAGALPLVVPPVDEQELDALLDLADGVLLTGSKSNVHPDHYGAALHDPSLPLDPARDAWTLPLIPRLLARGLPLLAICRGLQEVNVALGGTLHQAVQDLPGHADHREPEGEPVEVKYGDSHPARLQPGGCLAALLGGREQIAVNSLHGQGVDRLAAGLRVEARAPDGLVEAFSIPPDGAARRSTFALCVQWHPEWRAEGNPVSMQLLQAFGEACSSYRQNRPAAQQGPR
ncbi:gamma-glutamyl-gamma-aminobutyrate hydrolase family protein [Pelomonas sp. KK5]|uniref:gamma-glutamyl-gamma-aminobutyrate hydrolase family protein n=1 Tax=Pelomonas sp. KK5 TaxID=1855730 RepID=UPI00097BED31|nr:gamma-glutamyl-gamma-aminobutyrate hydrolase family protein [Pelomonas sp. KK5]